jgi:hypothetical protein
MADDELTDETSCGLLNRYLPKIALNTLFGGEDVNLEKVTAFRATQRIPSLTVYVLVPSQAEDHADSAHRGRTIQRSLLHMFKDVPSRLFLIYSQDFGEPGCVLRSAEQMASVAGADFLFSRVFNMSHCLILDGGTTLTISDAQPKGIPDGDATPVKARETSPEEWENGQVSPVAQANRDYDNVNHNGPNTSLTESSNVGEAATAASTVETHDPTATDINSRTLLQIVSDTRTLSVSGKLHALHHQTGALPEIDTMMVQKLLTELGEHRKLDLFANNTTDAILSCVLLETALILRSTIRKWVESKVLQAISTDREVNNRRRTPLICLTGMETNILSKLLGFDRSTPVIEMDDDLSLIWRDGGGDLKDDAKYLQIRIAPRNGSPEQVVEAVFQRVRHLSFHGVRRVIFNHASKLHAVQDPVEEFRQEILGSRVAKRFTGDPIVYRGTVVSVRRDEPRSLDKDWYRVRFDDGDEEEYIPSELYGEFAKLFY